MPVPVQIVLLLIQLFPSALKAIKAWQDYHGQKLDSEHRQHIVDKIKTMVQFDDERCKEIVKNLGKPT
jgi:hypothetical protein